MAIAPIMRLTGHASSWSIAGSWNDFVWRSSNGRTEGFNHGLRATLWRAFGISQVDMPATPDRVFALIRQARSAEAA